MHKRPLSLFICALLFLYFPLEMVARWHKGHPVYWLDVILSVVFPAILLFGLIRVARFGWYTLIALVALWGIRDLYEHYASRTSDVMPLLIHLAIYTVSLSYFINPRVRHLYFDPKRRWWRTKPRYETHLPFLLRYGAQWHYPIMRNISEGGCFIETAHPIDMGETIQVTLPLPVPLNLSVIRVEGTVRWVSKGSTSVHGMGVQFSSPVPEQSTAIKEFVRLQL